MNVGILIISNGWSGAEKVVYNTAKCIKDSVNLTLLLNDEIYTYYSDIEGIDLRNVGPIYSFGKIFKPFNYYRASKKIHQIIKNRKIDLLHLHLLGSLLSISPYINDINIPIIMTFHGSDIRRIETKESSFIDRYIVRNFARKMDHIICISEELYQLILKLGIQTPQVTVIPNSVDTAIYKPAKTKERLVIFSGRFIEIKNPLLLLDAIPKVIRTIDNIRFIFLGGGHLKPVMEKKLVDLDIKDYVKILPVIDTSPFLAKSMIYTSLQKYENYPSMSLLEAMASANAIIATNVGDTQRLVNEDIGCLIRANSKELADTIISMFTNVEDTLKKGDNARRLILKDFTLTTYRDKIIEIYEKHFNR